MCQSCTFINFVIIDKLVVLVLSGTKLNERFINYIQAAVKKIFPHHSQQVPTVMAHEDESEVKMNKSKSFGAVEKRFITARDDYYLRDQLYNDSPQGNAKSDMWDTGASFYMSCRPDRGKSI